MPKRLPSIYAGKIRKPPGTVANRPRVMSGVYGYTPMSGFRDRRAPTPIELVGAYRQAAYICANLNANAFASTPLHLYVETGRGQDKCYWPTKAISEGQAKHLGTIAGLGKRLNAAQRIEEVTEHPILDLLDHVNPWMNRFELLRLSQLYLEIVGASFWTFAYQSRLGKRVPAEIWPLPAWMVYPVPDFETPGAVIKEYVYTGGGGQATLPVDEVLYARATNLFSPYDQTYSPLRASYEMAEVYDKRNEYEDAMMTNRARPDALLIPKPETVVNPDEIQRIQAEFYQNFGLSQGGRVGFLPGGYEYVPMNYPPKDLEITAKQTATLHVIANCFGVPIPLVDVTSANRSILDAALIQHARQAIRPRCRAFEELLNSNFVSRFDARLFLAFDDPTPADVVLERETDRAYFAIGCRTPNEIRANQGLPALANGDEAFIPQGLVPLSVAMDRAQMAIKPAGEAPHPDEIPTDARKPAEEPEEPEEGEEAEGPHEQADDQEYGSAQGPESMSVYEEDGEDGEAAAKSRLKSIPDVWIDGLDWEWDPVLKRHVPCRDERGRFAPCGGADAGSRVSGGGGKPEGNAPPRKPGGTRKPRKPKPGPTGESGGQTPDPAKPSKPAAASGGKPTKPAGGEKPAAPAPASAGAHAALPHTDPNLAAHKEHVETITEEHAHFARQLGAEHGLTGEQFQAKVGEGFKQAVEHGDFYVRVRSDVVPKLLHEGRFKSQFETGSSGGALDAHDRAETEARVLATPMGTQAAARPIYGYVSNKDFGGSGKPHEKELAAYGDIVVKLKPHVRGTASVTLGDSLGSSDQLVARPATAADSSAMPMGQPAFQKNAGEYLKSKAPDKRIADFASQFGYIEAQHHGGLRTSDIEEIGFPRPPSIPMQAMLKMKGIKWRTIKS